jgi:hypothetical protein
MDTFLTTPPAFSHQAEQRFALPGLDTPIDNVTNERYATFTAAS